jgi:hypothetical protein
MELGAQFLENARFETRRLKDLAEKAVAQVEDDSRSSITRSMPSRTPSPS